MLFAGSDSRVLIRTAIQQGEDLMASNHGVVYLGPGKVEVQSIDYPELKTPPGKRIDHGVIIKPITTNICGSDQHMVRGRTTAPSGLVLRHEITGEEKILRVPEVDCAVDCVGFEAKGHGGKDEPAVVLNQLMEATRAAGAIGIPGLYVTEDPGAKDAAARSGNLTMRLGLGWAKSHSFTTGQTPVMKYNR